MKTYGGQYSQLTTGPKKRDEPIHETNFSTTPHVQALALVHLLQRAGTPLACNKKGNVVAAQGSQLISEPRMKYYY